MPKSNPDKSDKKEKKSKDRPQTVSTKSSTYSMKDSQISSEEQKIDYSSKIKKLKIKLNAKEEELNKIVEKSMKSGNELSELEKKNKKL